MLLISKMLECALRMVKVVNKVEISGKKWKYFFTFEDITEN